MIKLVNYQSYYLIKLIQVIIIAQQIAQGMGYLHHKGIIHKVMTMIIMITMIMTIMTSMIMKIMIMMHLICCHNTSFPFEYQISRDCFYWQKITLKL